MVCSECLPTRLDPLAERTCCFSQVQNARGERFDLGLAFAHTLLFTIWFSMFLPQVASVILMMTGARGQGLSDHILSTAAINRPRAY